MRRSLTALLAVALCLGALAPAGAASRMKTLGTDPVNDGPPALDITYLKAGRTGDALEIRIGVNAMLPEVGGYPELPGIEWVFTVGGRTFIAEGVAGSEPSFYLFEETANGFTQLDSPEGTYVWTDGYIGILVPLEDIGAKKGSVIKGAMVDPAAGGDVDAHLHVGPQTEYADAMETTKSFVVP